MGIGDNAASVAFGTPAVMHGFRSLVLQDKDGEPAEAYSVASGLDYPSVGPEHAYLHAIGRAEYVGVTDEEALSAFRTLSLSEGIIPALEKRSRGRVCVEARKGAGQGKEYRRQSLRPRR